ncbi:MAG: hypothetical protein ACM36C_12125 [Acidobacteriota bacterium]
MRGPRFGACVIESVAIAGALFLSFPATLLGAPGQSEGNPNLAFARLWVDAVREHQPGTVDAALLKVAEWGDSQFAMVHQQLSAALERAASSQDDRNNVLRRGVLLHTDIAILVPDRAARFTEFVDRGPRGIVWSARPPTRERPSGILVYGIDGQYVRVSAITAHWAYARMLLERIRPDPSNDPFVAGWYRATAAYFELDSELGFASPHLERARKVIPRDPWVLFYSGSLHEALAAPRYQNIERSRPPDVRITGRSIGRPRQELERTAEYYREATDAEPSFAAAHIRLGRVLGLLGRHTEALERLQRGLALTSDTVLRYYGDLFAAAEHESLERRDEAERAYERCAALFPAAQTPLVGLSELARRFGDRTAALDALQRLAALPAARDDRSDPWWVYLRQHAWNADRLLEDLRRPFLR